VSGKQSHQMKHLIENIKRNWFDFEDIYFERRYGLTLSTQVLHEQLVADNPEALQHATAYHAVWCRNLRVLLEEARQLGRAFDVFVDIGSGKGKACFYASTRLAFKQVLGVEFSGPLADIARANAVKFGDPRIKFLTADATCFDLPDSPCVVFLFNPFDEVILERFIKHNLDHFMHHGSALAYANDKHRLVLADHGFETIFRDPTRKISLHALWSQPPKTMRVVQAS
jgi:SAM-dependent methyltransferase